MAAAGRVALGALVWPTGPVQPVVVEERSVQKLSSQLVPLAAFTVGVWCVALATFWAVIADALIGDEPVPRYAASVVSERM